MNRDGPNPCLGVSEFNPPPLGHGGNDSWPTKPRAVVASVSTVFIRPPGPGANRGETLRSGSPTLTHAFVNPCPSLRSLGPPWGNVPTAIGRRCSYVERVFNCRHPSGPPGKHCGQVRRQLRWNEVFKSRPSAGPPGETAPHIRTFPPRRRTLVSIRPPAGPPGGKTFWFLLQRPGCALQVFNPSPRLGHRGKLGSIGPRRRPRLWFFNPPPGWATWETQTGCAAGEEPHRRSFNPAPHLGHRGKPCPASPACNPFWNCFNPAPPAWATGGKPRQCNAVGASTPITVSDPAPPAGPPGENPKSLARRNSTAPVMCFIRPPALGPTGGNCGQSGARLRQTQQSFQITTPAGPSGGNTHSPLVFVSSNMFVSIRPRLATGENCLTGHRGHLVHETFQSAPPPGPPGETWPAACEGR